MYERPRSLPRFPAGLVGLVALLVVGCANPRAPSGGPRDDTPPSIVGTRPVQDTVNVSTDTEALTIQFSEYIERTTLAQALSITPQFEERPQFDWSGQSVEIEFPAPLRDSTTYIFRFDATLTDAHGVSLDNPITVAFSTGNRINRGQIEGLVVNGRQGQPQARVDVYAYALPPQATGLARPLPDRPSYRTQTGEDGRFSFRYMREQRYYVVALKDNNRNRQPDPSEPFAVPPRFSLRADSGAAVVPVPWHLTRIDTLAPAVQRVQTLSDQRFQVNFSEPVDLDSLRPSSWAPRDSVTGTPVPVEGVWEDPDLASAIMVRTVPMQKSRYMLPLEAGVVADSVGQPLPPDTVRFGAATRSDTTRTRFRRFVPTNHTQDSTGAYPLVPALQPGAAFNQSPDSSALREDLQVQDTTGQARDFSLTTQNGTAYRIQLTPPLQPGEFIDVTVSGRLVARPDTTFQRRYRRVTRRALGGLEGQTLVADTIRQTTRRAADTTALRVPAPLTPGPHADTIVVPPRAPATQQPRRALLDSLYYDEPVVVELTPTQSTVPVNRRRLTTPPGSTFVFRELPEGQFRFRAFLDRDGDRHWNGGRIRPYVPAEPITWLQEPIDVRRRWTTRLPAPLRLPVLAPIPTRRPSARPDTTGSDTTSTRP